MKSLLKYFYLFLIYTQQVYAYNPAQQAMEDLADPEASGYHRSSVFDDIFLYLVLIGLGLAFLFSNLKTKLNVVKGALLFLFPLIVMYVLKQALPQDWKFYSIPILLIYMFKIDSIGSYVFPDEKEVPGDKIPPKKMNLYIDESEAQSRLNKDINTINSLYKAPETKLKYTCPSCKEKEAVGILYGYPTDETLQAWKNKEIELGGCIVGEEKPNRKCMKCNHEWKTNEND